VNLDPKQQALVALGERLRAVGYSFITPTPATQQVVNGRTSSAQAYTLAQIFGWSRPFAPDILPADLTALCQAAAVLAPAGPGLLRATVRWSSCAGGLFVHSAFPTDDQNAVFFGPDSYRFVTFLQRAIQHRGIVAGAVPRRLVDVGCGTGVGALALADRMDAIVLADINPRALWLAAVNARLNAPLAEVALVLSDVLASVDGAFDVIIANPPYLADEQGRTYRDGGGTLGLGLCARITEAAVGRLAPGGRFVLYTGTPVVAGRPLVCDQLDGMLRADGGSWSWELLDPDVFGEELARPAYAAADVEQIAVYGLVYWADQRAAVGMRDRR
jgi:SAM-dependent methyltransferase